MYLRNGDFHWRMNELYFRDYELFLDEQPDFGTTARLSEHADAAGGDYPQEFPVGDDDNVHGAGVRRSLYDQGPIFSELPGGTVLRVRHRNGRCLSIEISMGAPHERIMRQ